jgi:hypothetical protein
LDKRWKRRRNVREGSYHERKGLKKPQEFRGNDGDAGRNQEKEEELLYQSKKGLCVRN